MHKKVRDYLKIKLDPAVKVETGGRKRIRSRLSIDRTCFKKNSEEKLRLKLEKAKLKSAMEPSSNKHVSDLIFLRVIG